MPWTARSHRNPIACRSSCELILVHNYVLNSPTEMKTKEKQITVEWITDLAEWDAFSTFTMRGGKVSEQSVLDRLTDFFYRSVPTMSYFMVIEKHPMGSGFHAHCLNRFGESLSDKLTTNVDRSLTTAEARAAGHRFKWTPYDKLWAKAFKEFGRCEIKPLENKIKVTDYILKRIVDYNTKQFECSHYHLQFGNDETGREEARACGAADEDRIL